MIDAVRRKAAFWWHHRHSGFNARQQKLLNRLLDAEPEGFTGGLSLRKAVGLTHASRATAGATWQTWWPSKPSNRSAPDATAPTESAGLASRSPSLHHRNQKILISLEIGGHTAHVVELFEGIEHAQAGAQGVFAVQAAGERGDPAVLPAGHRKV